MISVQPAAPRGIHKQRLLLPFTKPEGSLCQTTASYLFSSTHLLLSIMHHTLFVKFFLLMCQLEHFGGIGTGNFRNLIAGNHTRQLANALIFI